MPITFKDDGATAYPVIECDWCADQIKDVDQGNIYWLHDEQLFWRFWQLPL
jgi:hypothetical protein